MAGKPSGKASSKTSRKPYRVGRSPTGLGLFASEAIEKGAFIVEYKGRRITNAQAKRLEARGSRYMYEINSRFTVDGSSRRNMGRSQQFDWRINFLIRSAKRWDNGRDNKRRLEFSRERMLC